MTRIEDLLDGRELTPYEREVLTILSEECNEVAVKVSKLLRFGACQTNPETKTRNHIELCNEVGDLNVMLRLFQGLQFYNHGAVIDGEHHKHLQLSKYSLHIWKRLTGEG